MVATPRGPVHGHDKINTCRQLLVKIYQGQAGMRKEISLHDSAISTYDINLPVPGLLVWEVKADKVTGRIWEKL